MATNESVDTEHCPACNGGGCSYCIEDREEPEGIAICDCGSVIMFGGCRDCGMSEDELTFHSGDDSDE